MTDTPLIYTSKGNIPLDSVEQRVNWQDDEFNTTFTESYFLNGELVKQSVHVMAKKGTEASMIASALV